MNHRNREFYGQKVDFVIPLREAIEFLARSLLSLSPMADASYAFLSAPDLALRLPASVACFYVCSCDILASNRALGGPEADMPAETLYSFR